ncbi:hypothetical protein EEL34_04190 [Muribaculaceae bacterium Isolate-039 (Harlan)]|jgi:hypothetical protein|uniref:DUF2007 domain-containing protein n=2 Tax=Duncaniella muris TaxID=2094150 RepID=A0A2V1IMW7_9BACT|nr:MULTISPECIES: hypothetical protein [Duncaniella]ROS90891.1 hypothetical protein EEL34_04190 [Muribaculaceae bacterium Isolate-039 (Harlan)]ROS96855.1 hypothetical protein EEL40_07905 [Muribaculaceae bacterium Isolate-083 (Janvier)]ROS98080.1 hypothetical protein EEL37_05370 [Muribaculaceae bacterium Isolate-077 (Janvier)]ROT01311.1 hypothetical protein EEL41_05865 [Muribaculaceae bacterium Isolate-084 (Janvier)]GFI53003.1 hypothetical protein IMSAGC021_01313 [Muribaculaceae bacterium]
MSLLTSLKEKLNALLSDSKPPAPDDLVRLRTYATAAEAYIDKAYLEANGIHAMVENEVEIYTPQIKTGVRLVIFYRDYTKAISLLDKAK